MRDPRSNDTPPFYYNRSTPTHSVFSFPTPRHGPLLLIGSNYVPYRHDKKDTVENDNTRGKREVHLNLELMDLKKIGPAPERGPQTCLVNYCSYIVLYIHIYIYIYIYHWRAVNFGGRGSCFAVLEDYYERLSRLFCFSIAAFASVPSLLNLSNEKRDRSR